MWAHAQQDTRLQVQSQCADSVQAHAAGTQGPAQLLAADMAAAAAACFGQQMLCICQPVLALPRLLLGCVVSSCADGFESDIISPRRILLLLLDQSVGAVCMCSTATADGAVPD